MHRFGADANPAVAGSTFSILFPFQNRSTVMFKPLGDRVAVRPAPADEKTSGGLYIPDTAKDKPQRGTVVAVGPGRTENGTHVEMSVSEGASVLYGKYAGTEITLHGEELLIMKESDLLGTIEE